jgi:hypothetical protein
MIKKTSIITIDELLMMKTMLQSVEIWLCQVINERNEPYYSKLMVFVNDHTKILIIGISFLKKVLPKSINL